ncbi:MAG: DNA-3-methyladenine glycosylase [Oscillospiraceae bacterium]|nr:DNA-3-methyladenine glycosylase [Oscillospiraceae bacterium]
MKHLTKDFFTQSAYDAAQQLIGKWICRDINGTVEKFQITETECYIGSCDTACHAYKGKTARTQIMWHEGGVCYVYLCYGLHQMLNFITGKEGEAEGVLIRGVTGAKGPGRATKAMQIDKSLYGHSLLTKDKIWVEDDGKTYKFSASKRIGIGYASRQDQDRLWRFELEE